ncbi:MAG: glucosaminidase domain-containing protein, partial [Brevinema sp.]
VSSYRVRITATSLNYRKGPGTNYAINGQVRKGEVYTIVSESSGAGAKKWGELKSGVGWLSLDYCQRL